MNQIENTPIKSVASAPVFGTVGYRVAIDNWGVPRDATAADVLRFEAEELGNDIEAMGVTSELLKELEKYANYEVIWVTKSKETARDYLSEGMTDKDISKIDYVKSGKIVAFDHQDGYLILASPDSPRRF